MILLYAGEQYGGKIRKSCPLTMHRMIPMIAFAEASYLQHTQISSLSKFKSSQRKICNIYFRLLSTVITTENNLNFIFTNSMTRRSDSRSTFIS